MSMSKSTNTYNRQNWEDSDFPILCQTCLGDNPYIRMTRERYGKECKICTRPFTVFRWCPGARMRFKKTEVCQTCSKMKNVCQTCLLDLEYGLPTQVRDEAMNLTEILPKSDVNKEYYIQNVERELANTDGTVAAGSLGKAKAPSEMLLRLARTTPYYKRNRPHICSFWVKGECKRGEECPYRHEKPTDPDDPLADQNIKDRYYGMNDPVADKLLKRAEAMPQLDIPDDKSITTLYVGNLGDITEKELRDYFYQFGEIRNVTVAAKQQFAFVTYNSRKAAEDAAEASFNKLIILGRRLNIKWGKAPARADEGAPSSDDGKNPHILPLPGTSVPRNSDLMDNNFFNLGPSQLNIPLPPGTGPDKDNTDPSVPLPPGSMPSQAPPAHYPSAQHQPAHLQPLAPPPFFPLHLRPTGMRPYQPAPMMPMMPPGHQYHYPSQDPTQMGALPSKLPPGLPKK